MKEQVLEKPYQIEFKNAIDKSNEGVFFRGGNQGIKMQVKPEHMKRIAKIFTDSEDEDEEEEEEKGD